MARSVAGPEIERLIQLLARLPGLGPRSARRAALALVKKKDQLLVPLASAMNVAAERILTCSVCGNIDTSDPCTICSDPERDAATIVVVEDVSDLWALERAGAVKARYHVLGGTLSPLDGVGPDDLTIDAARAALRRRRGCRGDPGGQRHRRWPDDGACHHRSPVGDASQGLAAGAWRAGRRRTRLSRRGHACPPRSGRGRRSEPDSAAPLSTTEEQGDEHA